MSEIPYTNINTKELQWWVQKTAMKNKTITAILDTTMVKLPNKDKPGH